MMNEEQRQQIVLEAIKECANVSDPVQYAQMNYRVYQVAMRAVEMATSNDAKQNLIKKQMRERYDELVGNKQPILYACVEVMYFDTEMKQDVTIKLSTDVNEDEDDDVFFYCDGIDELLKLTENSNGEDFMITAFDDFYETL